MQREITSGSHRKQPAQRTQKARAGQTHDDAGQQNAPHAGDEHVLEFHIKDGGGQRARPCAGARQRDAHKEQQRDHKAPTSLGLQRAASLFALDDAEVAEGADEGLVIAPDKDLNFSAPDL